MVDNTPGEGRLFSGYTFRLSRDFPRIWSDRIDIVVALSVFLAVGCLLLAGLLSASASTFMGTPSGVQSYEFPMYFSIAGGIFCLAATAYWLNAKSRTLVIESAPNISRINLALRLTFYLLLLWGPYALIYGNLAEGMDALYRGADRGSNFSLNFFSRTDPWMSWLMMSVASVVLVLGLTLQRFGTNQALAGLLFSLIWGGILFILSLIVGESDFVRSLIDTGPRDRSIAIVFGLVLLLLVALGLVFRGPKGTFRVMFQAPALYAVTIGPWMFVVGLWADRLAFSSGLSTQLHLLAAFAISGAVIALLVRTFRD